MACLQIEIPSIVSLHLRVVMKCEGLHKKKLAKESVSPKTNAAHNDASLASAMRRASHHNAIALFHGLPCKVYRPLCGQYHSFIFLIIVMYL